MFDQLSKLSSLFLKASIRSNKFNLDYFKTLNFHEALNYLSNNLEFIGEGIPKTWGDNDRSTRKWNIDHIIPHSKFDYKSVYDQAFKDCWALSNLRPYSAKLNIKEGNRR